MDNATTQDSNREQQEERRASPSFSPAGGSAHGGEPYHGAYAVMEKSFQEEQAQHEELRRDCGYHANHLARMIAGDSFRKMNAGDRQIVQNHLAWLQGVSGQNAKLTDTGGEERKESRE